MNDKSKTTTPHTESAFDLGLSGLNMSDSEAMDFADLESLFASAAHDAEGTLQDDNFTKMVINGLPSKPQRVSKLSLSLDLFGVSIGGLLALFLIDFKSLFAVLFSQGLTGSNEIANQLLSSATQVSTVASSPESFSVSLGTIALAVVATTVASLLAWYTVERSNSIV